MKPHSVKPSSRALESNNARPRHGIRAAAASCGGRPRRPSLGTRRLIRARAAENSPREERRRPRKPWRAACRLPCPGIGADAASDPWARFSCRSQARSRPHTATTDVGFASKARMRTLRTDYAKKKRENHHQDGVVDGAESSRCRRRNASTCVASPKNGRARYVRCLCTKLFQPLAVSR